MVCYALCKNSVSEAVCGAVEARVLAFWVVRNAVAACAAVEALAAVVHARGRGRALEALVVDPPQRLGSPLRTPS